MSRSAIFAISAVAVVIFVAVFAHPLLALGLASIIASATLIVFNLLAIREDAR